MPMDSARKAEIRGVNIVEGDLDELDAALDASATKDREA